MADGSQQSLSEKLAVLDAQVQLEIRSIRQTLEEINATLRTLAEANARIREVQREIELNRTAIRTTDVKVMELVEKRERQIERINERHEALQLAQQNLLVEVKRQWEWLKTRSWVAITIIGIILFLIDKGGDIITWIMGHS